MQMDGNGPVSARQAGIVEYRSAGERYSTINRPTGSLDRHCYLTVGSAGGRAARCASSRQDNSGETSRVSVDRPSAGLDLEVVADRQALGAVPDLLLRDGKGLVVIDEVQRKPELGEVLRSIIDDPQPQGLVSAPRMRVLGCSSRVSPKRWRDGSD